MCSARQHAAWSDVLSSSWFVVPWGGFAMRCWAIPFCTESCFESSITTISATAARCCCWTCGGRIGVGPSHSPFHHLCILRRNHFLCSRTSAGVTCSRSRIRACTRTSVNSSPADSPYQLLRVRWYIKVNMPQSVLLVCFGSLIYLARFRFDSPRLDKLTSHIGVLIVTILIPWHIEDSIAFST